MPDPDDRNGPLCRPQFFDRQALRAEDLNAVIDWIRARTRRHNRNLVGHGVAGGLEVSQVPGQPWMVQVARGYAVMPSGEEVAVPDAATAYNICPEARACLDIPGACPEPMNLDATGSSSTASVGNGVPAPIDLTMLSPTLFGPNPLQLGWAMINVGTAVPGAVFPTQRTTVGNVAGLGIVDSAAISLMTPLDALRVTVAFGNGARILLTAFGATGAQLDQQAAIGSGISETLTLTGAGILRVVIQVTGAGAAGPLAILTRLEQVALPRGSVYLALAAGEDPSGFKPMVPQYCRPAGNSMSPSRICETYRLKILCNLPDEKRDCASLSAIVCGPGHVPSPVAIGTDQDVVILATISVGDNGIVAIDDLADRRRILPQWLQGDLAECRCVVPTPPPPSPTPPPPTPTPTPPPTASTRPTRFSEFSILTIQPTRFTDIITFRPSLFTEIRPSLFTLPEFSQGPIFDPGDAVINPGDILGNAGNPALNPGTAIGGGILAGIGAARVDRLKNAGLHTLEDFTSASSTDLARILGTSEVKVAGMQFEALGKIGRTR
jgi:hypothetical protein